MTQPFRDRQIGHLKHFLIAQRPGNYATYPERAGTPANYRAYAVSREDVLLPDKDWPLPCCITPMFRERDGISVKSIARFF